MGRGRRLSWLRPRFGRFRRHLFRVGGCRHCLDLAAFGAGGPVFLDAPENNPAALELAHRHGMQAVFGCARMYLGRPPQLAHQRIFGVTTFELG